MQTDLVCIVCLTVCIMRPRHTATCPACMPRHRYRSVVPERNAVTAPCPCQPEQGTRLPTCGAGLPTQGSVHVQAAQLCRVSKPEPLLVLMGHPVRQPQVAAILRGLHAPVSKSALLGSDRAHAISSFPVHTATSQQSTMDSYSDVVLDE